MEKTDTLSVQYIMKKSKKNLTHSEYIKNTFEDYFDNELIDKITEIKKEIFIPISLEYVKNQKRIWMYEKDPKHKIFMHIIKKVKHAYIRTNIICFLLNPMILLVNQKSKLINRITYKRDTLENFYKELKAERDLRVDYPYSYLKHYLEKNNLDYLAKYVTWDNSSGRKTKAFIIELISFLNENDYSGMKYIKGRGAHIRFMNSAYYSQRILFVCARIVFFIVLLILFLRFLFLYSVAFNPKYPFSFNTNALSDKILFIVDKAFDYITRIVNYEDMFVILCISAVYMLFYLITKSFVLGNFHYQRIREIIWLLQAKHDVLSKTRNNP